MKKCRILLVMVFSLLLAGCSNQSETEPQTDSQIDSQSETVAPATESENSETDTNEEITDVTEQTDQALTADTITEQEQSSEIQVTVGDQSFSVTLYDNEAARALRERLPLTLDMDELNGNEKYFNLPEPLPVDSQMPGNIESGDLMLYGSDCLVLFYESFATSYSYTPLGYMDDPAGLAAALGSDHVTVTFSQ